MTIKILKNDTCTSISGKSTLKYQIGADADDAILLRITGSSGGGFFSNEWIAFEKIQDLLDAHPADKPITSIVLYPLFRGKSVNTPGFLLAVLAHEKLLIPMQGKKRSLEAVDLEAITEWVERLGSGKAKPKGASRKKASAASRMKAQLKKKSVASRKKVRGS